VSCSNYGYGYFNGYADIAKQADISAVLHLGDYIYEYPEGFYRDNDLKDERPIFPENEIISLEDYRLRYACYRTDIDLQECHRQHPFIAVWDDHEIADNSWKGGARFHFPSKGSYIERNDSTRFAKGLVTQTSTNHLVDSSQARSIMDSPALASKDKAVAVKTV
jgi:alkaline phosphatase D